MQKIIFFCSLLVSCYLYAQETKPQVLVYADAGYPPYASGNMESKYVEGIYVKIVQKIFFQMANNYSITLLPMPWKRAIDATKTGKAFGVIPPYKNLAARPWLNYSHPILTEQLAVFCNDKEGVWPTDYKGKQVAINYGFTFTKEVLDSLTKNTIDIAYPKDNAQSLEFLYTKKVSCYINDGNSIYYSIKLLGFNKDKVYLKSILETVDGYLGYSNDKQAFPFGEKFIEEFNNLLDMMKKNGEVEKITREYFQ